MSLEVPLIPFVNPIQVRYLLLQIFLVRAQAFPAGSVIAHLVLEAIGVFDASVVVVSGVQHNSGGVSPDEE